MGFYDFNVLYKGDQLIDVLRIQKLYGFEGICMSFDADTLPKINYVAKLAKEMGFEFYSRYNICANDIRIFKKQVYRMKKGRLSIIELHPRGT